jgi:predicted regulator of Ras-like GTPase activity (Roadblock/LC7/MglB family)
MDAAQAISELMEVSTQVTAAVVLGSDGTVLASSTEQPARADALAGSARELVRAAAELGGGREVTRVEVELRGGAVFVLGEGGRTVAARTGPEPSAGLVVYDLRTCLRSIEEPPKRKRAARKKKESASEPEEPAEQPPTAGEDNASTETGEPE